jgi:hypothetical protein
MSMIDTIKECKHCGMEDGDFEDGHLRGFGDTCVFCGAVDDDWQIRCTCGNELVWDEYGEFPLPECPKCGTHNSAFEVTAIDSAFIINNILKRPDLHRKREYVPVSFVETLMDYLQAQ